MRFKVLCKQCGAVLLDYKNLFLNNCRWQAEWYTFLYNKLKGKCPGCGRELPLPFEYPLKMKIEVSTRRET